MSYFSDIDLATLHQSRLNERIQYKLSWLNGRQKYSLPITTTTNTLKQKNATYNHANNKTVAATASNGERKKSTNGVNNSSTSTNGQQPSLNKTKLMRKNATAIAPSSCDTNNCVKQQDKSIKQLNSISNSTIANDRNCVKNKLDGIKQSLVVSPSAINVTNNNCNNSKKIDANHSQTNQLNGSDFVDANSHDRLAQNLSSNQSNGDDNYCCNDAANANGVSSTASLSSSTSSSPPSAIPDHLIDEIEHFSIGHRKRSGTWP